MRKLILNLIIGAILGLLIVHPCFAFTTAPKDDANCELAYLFTEGSNTTVADDSSNSNTGNFKSSGEPVWNTTDVSFAVSGSAPNSVDFDGSNDYIDCGTDASLDIAEGTVVFRFNCDASSTAQQVLFGKDGSGTNNGDFHLAIARSGLATSGKLQWQCTNATTLYEIYSDSAISYTNWTYVALVFGTGGMRMYVNGTLQADTDAYAGGMTNSTPNLFLGVIRTATSPFNGKMTEVAAFSRQLSSTEINQIMDYGLASDQSTSSTLRVNIITTGIGSGIGGGIR